MPWTSADWQQRRADFMKHALAMDILEWRKIDGTTAGHFRDLPVNTRRYVVSRSMLACASLGSADSPKGRREAYCEAVFPFDWDIPNHGAVADPRYTPNPNANGTSSCGTFIRGIWQLLGGGDDNSGNASKSRIPTRMHQSYGALEIFKSLAIWAWNCDGLHGDYYSWTKPGSNVSPSLTGIPLTATDHRGWDAGDVLYMEGGGGQHILTIVEPPREYANSSPPRWSVATVEGGKGKTGDGLNQKAPCEGIQSLFRDIKYDKGVYTLTDLGMDVKFWIDFSKLDFTDPEFFVAHRGPNHPEYKQKGH